MATIAESLQDLMNASRSEGITTGLAMASDIVIATLGSTPQAVEICEALLARAQGEPPPVTSQPAWDGRRELKPGALEVARHYIDARGEGWE